MKNILKETPFTPFQRLIRLLRVDRKEIGYIYIFAVLSGLINLTVPIAVQSIINLVQGGRVSASWILLTVLVTAGIGLAGIMQVIQITVSEKIRQRIFARSSFEFAFRIARIRPAVLKSYRLPELVNRFFDTMTIQKELSKILIDFSAASLQMFFGLILLTLYHPFFIIFGLIICLLAFLIFKFTGIKGLRTSITESKFKYETARWLEELARTADIFKLAGDSSLLLKKTNTPTAKYLSARKEHFKVLKSQYAMMVIFKVVIAAGLLILGGLLVIEQRMNLGQFVAAEIIILLIMNSTEKLIMIIEALYDSLTAVEKLAEVTDLPQEEVKGENINSITPQKPLKVELSDVEWSHSENSPSVIKNLSFIVEPGERICVSGPADSGKSTLPNVIAGLGNHKKGIIAFNDLPIGNLNIDTLRSIIGLKQSEETFFEGTILENITMGRKDIPFSRVTEVIDRLFLTEFIKQLPQGYDTQLENLKETLCEKLLIARAIVHNPKLIVMRTFFDRLEKEERESIINYLTDTSNPWTLIGISNSKTFAQTCNKVLIMRNGKIAATDTPESIINHPEYKSLYHA